MAIGGITSAIRRQSAEQDRRAEPRLPIDKFLNRRPEHVRGSATMADIGLTSPKDGDVMTKSPAHITGDFAGGGVGDTLLINGVAVTTMGGPWSTDVELKEGTNTIEYSIVSDVVYRGSFRLTYRPSK